MDKKRSAKITEKEIAIIKRAQAGDESAFTWIFKKYKRFVTKILYGYLSDWDEARDITNVVFLKVHDKLSKFKTYNSFGGWLRVLTNRTAVDYLRKTKNHRSALDEDFERLSLLETDSYTEEEVVNHLTVSRIFAILDKLDPQIKQIFEMFYLENMTVEKISDCLRIPTGTIKSHLSRTRKKLQKQLKLQQ